MLSAIMLAYQFEEFIFLAHVYALDSIKQFSFVTYFRSSTSKGLHIFWET